MTSHARERREEQPASLTERAYSIVKRRIIRLELLPGAVFTEGALSKEFGFSKTPVREALTRLQREGLVEAMPRAGYRATAVTLRDARDLFSVRMMLEPEAAALAAANRIAPERLLELEVLCRQSFDPQDQQSMARFLAANTQFHYAVAQASENELLAEMIHDLLNRMERLLHLKLLVTPRATDIVHEHQTLLEALRAEDPESARAIAAAQIGAARDKVMEALLSSPSAIMTPGQLRKGL